MQPVMLAASLLAASLLAGYAFGNPPYGLAGQQLHRFRSEADIEGRMALRQPKNSA